MIIKIYVSCDGNWESPEVQIFGTASEMAKFGKLLLHLRVETHLRLNDGESKHYPLSIKNLVIKLRNADANNLLSISVNEECFTILGSYLALKKLGESLINYFEIDSFIGDHFHLEYFEGNHIIDKTNCNLIFVCDR